MDRKFHVLAGVVASAITFLIPVALPAFAATGVREPPIRLGQDAWQLCTDTAHDIERREQLPETMLEAISTAETAHAVPGEKIVRPWPWTVTAEGKGQFYATKSAAVEAVRALRAQGVTNIDIGCMQVNLHFHPGAFTSLEEAFSPASNIAYAANLLKKLKKNNGSWEQAIEHYHSYDPGRRQAYRLRVFGAWQDIAHDREVFRLASEVSLEPFGAPGGPILAGAVSAEAPLTASRVARPGAAIAKRGPVVKLTALDLTPTPDVSRPAPIIVIAVDLRPRASDRPDAEQASVFGGTTVAAADPFPPVSFPPAVKN